MQLGGKIPGSAANAVDWSHFLQPVLMEFVVFPPHGQPPAPAVWASPRAAVEHFPGLCLRHGELLPGRASDDSPWPSAGGPHCTARAEAVSVHE